MNLKNIISVKMNKIKQEISCYYKKNNQKNYNKKKKNYKEYYNKHNNNKVKSKLAIN